MSEATSRRIRAIFNTFNFWSIVLYNILALNSLDFAKLVTKRLLFKGDLVFYLFHVLTNSEVYNEVLGCLGCLLMFGILMFQYNIPYKTCDILLQHYKPKNTKLCCCFFNFKHTVCSMKLFK